ncbi:MAG: hypothetical protein SFU98_08330 [Leptospiraceae bacterium]|nr:hypothetical protein [Leptospiraceae bacterium]
MSLFEVLSIYIILQCLFTTITLQIISKLFPSLRIEWKSGFGIFILPLFTFISFGLEINIKEAEKKDSGLFKIDKLFLFINPIYFLFARLRIDFLFIDRADIFYLNKIPSRDKQYLLPKSGLVKIRNAYLRKSILRIEDRTVFPNFKIDIKDILLLGTSFDVTKSIELLFKTRRGECKIGNGEVSTRRRGNKGILKLKGVTLGEITNLDFVPIPPFNQKLYLIAEFHHKKKETIVQGSLGRPINKLDATKELKADELKNKLTFGFSIEWSEYELLFDLALKKIIMKLVSGGVINEVVNTTVEFLAKLLTQPPTSKTTKEKKDSQPLDSEADQS